MNEHFHAMNSSAPDITSNPEIMKGVSLELSRMARAMVSVTQSWDALHVAGTNGKGSVCTYLSALCKRFNLDNGLFTSPYLVEPRDAVKINGIPISQQNYTQYRQKILDDEHRHLSRDESTAQPEGAGASPDKLTEFELGTLIAFSAFDHADVKVGIVEVGLGGRLDSTNAMPKKKVSVITKIGLDHQRLLGDTLPQIAKEKAGIMMANVPCVVDGSNPAEVLDVFRQHAQGVGAPLHVTTDNKPLLDELYESKVMPHQAQNMACAITAFGIAFPHLRISVAEALPILKNTAHLGRLSELGVTSQLPAWQGPPVLVDGAHNPQSAGTLSNYVETRVRKQGGESVTWIVAVSKQDGKDAKGMLRTLVRPGDTVICCAFRKRPTMPWVEPVEPSELRKVAADLGVNLFDCPESEVSGGSLADAMAKAASQEGPVVVTGSLYLVGDSYRLYGNTLD